jgi:hypothetical protein
MGPFIFSLFLALVSIFYLSVFWTRGTLNRLVNFMLRVHARMD